MVRMSDSTMDIVLIFVITFGLFMSAFRFLRWVCTPRERKASVAIEGAAYKGEEDKDDNNKDEEVNDEHEPQLDVHLVGIEDKVLARLRRRTVARLPHTLPPSNIKPSTVVPLETTAMPVELDTVAVDKKKKNMQMQMQIPLSEDSGDMELASLVSDATQEKEKEQDANGNDAMSFRNDQS